MNWTNTIDFKPNLFQYYGTLVTSALSVIGTLSIFIPIFSKCACSRPAVTQLLHISIADFLASLFVLSTVINYLYIKETTLYCIMTGHISNAFYVSSFIFIILYAAQALTAIHEERTNGKIWRIFNTKFLINVFNGIYILAWIVPVTLTIPVYWIFEKASNLTCFTCSPLIQFKISETCKKVSPETFIHANLYRYLFLSAQSITLLTLVVLSVTLIQYYKHIASNEIIGVAEQKLWEKRKERVIYFIFSFVFCWFTAILVNILFVAGVTDRTILNPLYIIKSLTNPLHGILNAIVYGWQRRTFTNIFRKPANADIYNQPNYESYSNRNFIRSFSYSGFDINTETISENQRLNT